MIHPNDVMVHPDYPGTWLVVNVNDFQVQVELQPEVRKYMYPKVDADTLELVEGSGWSVMHCPHTVQPVMATDGPTERGLAMANNTGRMEATIEILFDRIRRMGEVARVYGHLGVLADCEAMQDTITRCVLGLQDLPLVNGGSKTPELKAYITAQQ